jgi:hypothetical protein
MQAGAFRWYRDEPKRAEPEDKGWGQARAKAMRRRTSKERSQTPRTATSLSPRVDRAGLKQETNKDRGVSQSLSALTEGLSRTLRGRRLRAMRDEEGDAPPRQT